MYGIIDLSDDDINDISVAIPLLNHLVEILFFFGGSDLLIMDNELGKCADE